MDGGERLVGISDYLPTQQDEIKLTTGDVVTVLFSYEDGWVLARNESTGAVGLLPRNFLDKEQSAGLAPDKGVGRLPTTRTASLMVKTRPSTRRPAGGSASPPKPEPQPAPAAAPPPAGGTDGGGERLVGICEYLPQNSDEIKLAVGNVVTVLFSYEDGWILARNESSGGVGLLPRNFLDVENARVGNVGTRSPTVRTASLVTRKGRDGGGKTGATSAAGSSTLQPPAAAPPAVTASSPDGKERLVGICEYIPQNSDEIRLNVGDKVSVLFTYEDGWILGKNETLSVVGLLPRNFLDKDTGAPPAAQSSFSRTPTVRTASLVVRNNQQQSSGPKPALPTSSAAPAAAPVASVPLVSSTPITTPSSYQISQQTQQQQAPAIPRGSNDPASLRNAAAYPPPLLPPIKLDGPNASADTAATAKKKLAASVKARNNRMKIPANMGTLKLAVVGDLSIGKTSLIKKFLQMTEIVLADPLPPASASGSIREIRASTIPAAELQVGEERLNLTFVDTPGYGASMDALAIIGPVGEYCLTQYGKSEKAFSREITRNQIIRFMNAGTGAHSHVDVCIYGILHRITPIDLEYMRRLSRFVTIVPVILKCDTMFKAEVTRLKVEVLEALAACGVRIYGFGLSHEECTALARGGELGAPPFAVSCLDEEESTPAAGMKGRCESEFDTLKTALFFNHIGDLRNMSAEKFADWYEC